MQKVRKGIVYLFQTRGMIRSYSLSLSLTLSERDRMRLIIHYSKVDQIRIGLLDRWLSFMMIRGAWVLVGCAAP